MKRFVMMIFAVCLLSLPAFAYKAYCVVLSSDTGKYVTVQFGNSEDKKKLVGDDGKELKFESYAALLDYMAKNGWQFKQLSLLDRGHYLTILEKEVNIDDEIQKGLKLE